MINAHIRNSLLFSLVGHTCVFLFFSFSFSRVLPQSDYSPIVFLGQLLPEKFSVYPLGQRYSAPAKAPSPDDDFVRAMPVRKSKGEFSLPVYCVKPKAELAFNTDKPDLVEHSPVAAFAAVPKESSIMFHPLLPYQLQLYFKDRQSVHIELMFNIVPSGERNSIQVKRKISSGNLEADLLSKRYIEHYLFIQQARFLSNTWQTVKIDLSND